MHWHERIPERWEGEQLHARKILERQRGGIDGAGVAFIDGIFHIRSAHGHRYDSVTIRVEYPSSFPDRGRAPKIILSSHRDRWRRGGNSHINGDWSLCLFVPGDSGIDFRRDDALNALFAVLHTFLFKEHLYQRDLALQSFTGRRAVWPGEARSHGLAGVAEVIREKGGVGRNESCPCGSGKKYKVCCMRRIRG